MTPQELPPGSLVRCVWVSSWSPRPIQTLGHVVTVTAENLRLVPLLAPRHAPKVIALDRIRALTLLQSPAPTRSPHACPTP